MPDPKRITIHKLDNGGIVWEDENGNQLPPNWDTLKQWAGEGIGNMVDRITGPPEVSAGQLGSPAAAQEVQDTYVSGGQAALNPGIVPLADAPGMLQNAVYERKRALDEAAQ